MNKIKIHGIYVGIPGKRKTYGGEAVWPSIERQVKEAQAENREKYAQSSHKPVQLYTMLGDCEHEDPDDMDKFDGVEDLEDEFLDRIGLGHENPYSSPGEYEMYWAWVRLKMKNLKRAAAVIPLVAEYNKASDEYQDTHGSGVCLEDPQDLACSYCDQDALDYGDGVSDPGCDLNYEVTEAWENFWDAVSPEGYEYIQRRHREQA